MVRKKIAQNNLHRPRLTFAVCIGRTMRPSARAPHQLRNIQITRGFTRHAEGSVLIECGDTLVNCIESV